MRIRPKKCFAVLRNQLNLQVSHEQTPSWFVVAQCPEVSRTSDQHRAANYFAACYLTQYFSYQASGQFIYILLL